MFSPSTLGVPRDLDWRGGAVLLYIIDLAKPFSPEASSWQSIESEGQSWTFGGPQLKNLTFTFVRNVSS